MLLVYTKSRHAVTAMMIRQLEITINTTVAELSPWLIDVQTTNVTFTSFSLFTDHCKCGKKANAILCQHSFSAAQSFIQAVK
jgi:hypothetical protein